MLKIAPIKIKGPAGIAVHTFALLDGGATISIVDKKLARRVGIYGKEVDISVCGLWSDITNVKCERIRCEVEGEHGAQLIEHALIVPKLELPSQTIPFEIIDRVKLQTGIDLSKQQNARPQMLLGQDNWRLIESIESHQIRETGLVISRSHLGWVVHGYTEENKKTDGDLLVHTICCATNSNATDDPTTAQLDSLIKDYFEMDGLGISDTATNHETEDRAMRILRETTRKVGKRWETGLLWKSDELPLLDTRTTALKRLYSLEKRLDKDPKLAALYYKEIERWIANGYAVKVGKASKSSRVRYLSHFAVQNPNKPDKVRPVLDAAEKTDDISHNDLLETGPVLLESAVGVQLRFRQYPYAVVSDIKDMYLRVGVIERDRDAQRILYRGANRSSEPEEYAMTCLIFGAKSSPCSALYVKNQNAQRFARVKPEAAKSIVRNSYMDDFLASGKSREEMQKLVRDVALINAEANFVMHDWASNDPEVLSFIREESQLSKEQTASLCDKIKRVLGSYWDRLADAWGFNVGWDKIDENVLLGETTPTKRKVFSIAMSVYDPLGLLSPFTLGSKLIMQDLWRSGVGWDSKIRDGELKDWLRWLTHLKMVKDIKIPRCLVPKGSDHDKIQLHVFCDASKLAYAAVAYIRTEHTAGKAQLSLVMAKTRVAPSKPSTIPRLELQAALLGSKIATTIGQELDISISARIFWSDSTTVLHWIRAGPRLKQVFVANRLGQIGASTKTCEWKWVPTLQNPADDATRPLKEPMRSSDRWFVGPEFLREPPPTWPTEKKLDQREATEIDKLEAKRIYVCYTFTAKVLDVPARTKILGWFGLLGVPLKLKKCLERWSQCSNEKRGIAIQPKQKRTWRERRLEAETFWYREIQATCFPQELDALKNGKELHAGSKLVPLCPFIDEEGLMRARGRVTKLLGVRFQNHPIILDAEHFATKLLIAAYHRRYKHQNNETVVNELRQQYYIIGLRARLRWLAKNCLSCRLQRAKPNNPKMADLPECRVAYQLRPFSHCGIDYFGPMLVKIGRRQEKRWGVLFTCMTTRAIHLELANTLTASSAIMAIQRLAGRRGMPRAIYSDNGTNFTKASKELYDGIVQLDQKRIKNFADEKGFDWHYEPLDEPSEKSKEPRKQQSSKKGEFTWRFNPADAPHMGGAWERHIRSVKTALAGALKEQIPAEEVLATLLVEIEHMVNSRPLTHVSVDPRDEEALTPNHFLIGASSGHLSLLRYEAEILSPRKTFEIVQNLATAFWKRWLREYLPTLLPRNKWRLPATQMKVGDIVLIVDFQTPRNSWRKGKIIEVYPNRSDGVIRVVKVRSGKSTLTRPVHKLVKICESA